MRPAVIDSFIADDFGRTLKLGLSVVIIFSTITVVGGIPFLLAASLLAVIYSFREIQLDWGIIIDTC
jgi:hypothetical protein